MQKTRWLLALSAILTLTSTSNAQTPSLTALVLAQLFGQDAPEPAPSPHILAPRLLPAQLAGRVAEGHVALTLDDAEESEPATNRVARTFTEQLMDHCASALGCCDAAAKTRSCAKDACCAPTKACPTANKLADRACCMDLNDVLVRVKETHNGNLSFGVGCNTDKGLTGSFQVLPRGAGVNECAKQPCEQACPLGVLQSLAYQYMPPAPVALPPVPLPPPFMMPYPAMMPGFIGELPSDEQASLPPLPPEVQQLLQQRQLVRNAIERIEQELVRVQQKRQQEHAEMHVSYSPATAHLVTETFEAHCTRVTCLGKADRLLLDGDVTLVWKKNGQNLRISAQRIVINVKDDSFFVDSGSEGTADRASQFGAHRGIYPQPPVVPAGYYVPVPPQAYPVPMTAPRYED